MSELTFLEGILPERTRYSLRLIRKVSNQAKNVFFQSLADMANSVQTYCTEGWDVYYVTAGLGSASNATADNAVAKRELYVDVDCGPSKPYGTKEEGVAALREFCKSTGLPRPTVVDSGNGLHAHWIFRDPVPAHKWKPAADAFKTLCKDKGFQVDASCTADIVRVLRVPGTVNFKNNTSVEQLTPVAYYDFGRLAGIITGLVKAVPGMFSPEHTKRLNEIKRETAKAPTQDLTRSLSMGDPNRVSKFETIWLKSIKGTGCAQIAHAIKEAETLSEPMWRGALSIAQVCEDRDWAIHALSENHPQYTPEETENKASLTKGPYTCETFQTLEDPERCKDCPHMGKITSPVQLGYTIKQAKPTGNVVTVNRIQYDIPQFPFPYFRGANGGVYMKTKDSDESEGLELVYPHDLYVYKRMRDPDHGDVVCMRHHLPHDGVREFIITQKEVGAVDKLRDRLSEQGVAAFSVPQLQKLQRFIGSSIQDLQTRGTAETMFSRFGWTADNTFVVGNREYTPDGVRHVPVARNLDLYVQWFTPKGSLEEWKSIVSTYAAEGMEPYAFGLLAGFGSILMKMSPEKGGVVSYYSKLSGTGKTTLLKSINSIFGDPDAMMKDAQDTHMTKVHRMGMLNGICLALDEMTNATPLETSALLYGSTQGRPRDRMKSGENAERVNNLMWRMISVWTSNTSIEDKLSTIKIDPQGEMARVIEVPLKPLPQESVLETQKLFQKLNYNYGHAGDVFMRYVVPNQSAVQKLWNDTRDLVYNKRKWSTTERFRLNKVICILTAGIVLNQLGLTTFNLSRIAKWAVDRITTMNEEAKAASVGAIDTFGMFINENISNMLRIDSKARTNKLQAVPYMVPKGKLIIRYEPDTKELFIVQKDFNRWCANNYINAREIKGSFYEATGKQLEVVRKRMGSGWDTDFGIVWAYRVVNASEVLGLDVDEVTNEEEAEAA